MADSVSVYPCRGKKPRRFSSARIVERPHLLQRMMSQRQAPRFIVAPSGYGKTFLALEYARAAFGFEHVVWVDAQEPDFVRRLDAGALEKCVLDCCESVSLVVVDGVTRMDVRRAEELSRCMDAWLDAGIEVVTTMTPGCDAFSRRQVDRLLLTGEDLLLRDEGEGAAGQPDGPCVAGRIACMAWPLHDGQRDFAHRCACEPLPTELACMAFFLQLVGQGSLQPLSYLLPGRDTKTALMLLARYPHLGVNLEDQSFCAMDVDPFLMCQVYERRLDRFCQVTGLPDFDSFVRLAAQKCLEAGLQARASNVVCSFASARLRKEWARQQGVDMLWSLQAWPLERLLSSVDLGQGESDAQLLVLRALCNLVLDSRDPACVYASQALSLAYSDKATQLCALLLLSRIGGEVEAGLVSAQISRIMIRPDSLTDKEVLLARLCSNDESCLDALASYAGRATDMRMLDLACCWAFGAFPSMMSPFLEKAIRRFDGSNQLDLAGLMVAKTCQKAASMGLVPKEALSSDVVIKVFEADTQLLGQRMAWSDYLERTGAGTDAPGGLDDALVQQHQMENAPLMEIRLFGSFKVSIGGRPVGRDKLNRTNARALLTVLALHSGKEYSRDKLARELWPTSDHINARRNCYTSFSSLRKAFTLPDGTCPYLSALSHGYRLEAACVHVDVERVRQILDTFRLGKVDNEAWQELLVELERMVEGGLAPGEGSSSLVIEARQAMQQRITDALIVGSERLMGKGYAMTALGFAMAVPRECALREDVCFALMRAQMACDQRQEALATFFRIRDHLEKELGVEPSARLMRLYLSVINSDDVQSGGLVDFG